MKIFEAHKRASFAEKLFAKIGFDFNAALETNDENALAAHIGTQPGPAVAALFSAAGLDVAALVAAGPDALKAHLASIDNSAEVTRLTGELAEVRGQMSEVSDLAAGLEESLVAATDVYSAIGLSLSDPADPEAVKKAFAAHVEKQATLKLAATGHPPAHVPAAADAPAAPKEDSAAADEAKLAEYEKLSAAGDAKARTEFYAANDVAIHRAYAARGRK